MTPNFNSFISLLFEQTKISKSEMKFYFDEIFGELGENLTFIESSMPNDHPKFDRVNFSFEYRKKNFVKVFCGPGEDSSKHDNGSVSVVIFIFDSPTTKNYHTTETNAFYNAQIKKVSYDPVLQTGESVIKYIKAVLDRDDRSDDFEMPEIKPPSTIVPKELVHV